MTNSIHDMGGMTGFGAIPLEDKEPVFHAEWERRAFGLMMTALGPFQVNLDNVRSRMEAIPPATYVNMSYYEKWIAALEDLIAERGDVSTTDLQALANGDDLPLTPCAEPFPAEGVLAFLATGATAARQIETPDQFDLGDQVRAKNLNPPGHTRLPRYVRGKVGVITAEHGGQIYPDTNAVFAGEGPERLYTVAFKATELWGLEVNAKDSVYVDLWEPYLESVKP